MDRDKIYLTHIVEAVRKIRQYTEGFTFDSFKGNTLVQDGVVRQLEIIREASRMVSERTRRDHPDIPWYEIAGMRNRLRLACFRYLQKSSSSRGSGAHRAVDFL